MSKNIYLENFCKSLEALGLTYDEVVKNYKYSGGNRDPKTDEDTTHSNYFSLCFPYDEFPENVLKCLCEHPIINNCYITKDNDIDTLLIVGMCCIKKFNIVSTRTCELCAKPHKNRKINYCNECKEGVRSGYTKKCIKCKSLNKVLSAYNKCKVCCIGCCLRCDKKIDPKFKYCYNCNLIKKK